MPNLIWPGFKSFLWAASPISLGKRDLFSILVHIFVHYCALFSYIWIFSNSNAILLAPYSSNKIIFLMLRARATSRASALQHHAPVPWTRVRLYWPRPGSLILNYHGRMMLGAGKKRRMACNDYSAISKATVGWHSEATGCSTAQREEEDKADVGGSPQNCCEATEPQMYTLINDAVDVLNN